MTLGSGVLGLVNGMLIALLGIGIVLTYRSSRFLNMAHAQMGALSAELLAKFVLDWHLNWWVAFALCVPIGMVVGVVVDRVVVEPLRERSASAVTLLLVTIGVAQVLLAAALVPAFGPKLTRLNNQGYPLPFHASVHIGNVILNGADILVVVIAPLLVAGLAATLQFTRLGRHIRAAASNPDAARLAGISTKRMATFVWAAAAGVSAIAAILQSPSASTFSASALGPQLLLLGLGAAAFGAFTSLPLTLIGGLVLGIAQQLALAQTSSTGSAELVVVVLILAAVLVRGNDIGRVFQTSGAVVKDRPAVRVPAVLKDSLLVRYQRRGVAVAAIAAGLLAPLVPLLRSDGKRFQLSLVLVYALVALSLTVAIGWAGQVSLGQFALVGAGAFVSAHLLGRGWSLPIVLLISAAVGALAMAVVGIPALRVPGLTLAVTTLGLAVVAPDWLFHQHWFGSTRSSGMDVNAPGLVKGAGHPGSILVVYYASLLVLVLVAAGLWSLRRSSPGRTVVAVRDNEAKAASFGVTPATVKMVALLLSGALAAAAGVLWADAWRTVASVQFPAEASFSVLAAPIIGGLGSVAGAIIGAVVLYAPVFFISPYVHSWFGSAGDLGFELLFGGLGLIVVVLRYPAGLAGAAQEWWQRRVDRMAVTAAERTPLGDAVLEVREIHVAFGGLTALNGVSIDVAPGSIVGLIGPNGAGKTTLMNVISGALTPDAGTVHLGSIDLAGLAPEVRFAYGLARTFQNATLFPGLTVLETIQMAMTNQYRIGFAASAVGAPWARHAERRSRTTAMDIVERFGLGPWSGALTEELSTGTRRICDLAAQVACRPRVLLLDEPTAGVAQREAEAFTHLLRRIRDELDCSILIIEHDMPLLMGVCDHVYAMEAGRVISEGTPEEIREDPRVIASYLGTGDVAVNRSNGTTRRRARAGRK